MTDADTLRRAAEQIREQATAATPGPWKALADGYGDTSGGRAEEDRRDLFWVRAGETNAGDIVSTYGSWGERSAHDVTHIASWSPPVALAVADLLHEVACAHYPLRASANNYPYGCATCYPSDGDWPCSTHSDALTVARAYRGEA